MALQTMQSDGGLGDITNLLNLVKDQKTTSSTTSNLTDAGVQAQINNILGGNQGLAAVAGAQHNAGFYNSTVNTQMVNDLLTRTAAQVQAQKAGSTTTQTKKAPVSSSQALLTIGSLALKNSDKAKAAYKYLTGGSQAGATSADVDKVLADSNLATNTNDVAGISNLESSAASGGDLGGLSTGASSTDVATSLSDILGSAGAASNADVASALSSVSGASTGTDVAGLTSLDSAAASEGTAAAAGSGTADAAGLAALDSAAVDSEGASAGLTAGDAAAGEGAGSLSGTAAAGWGALAVATAIDANATQSGNDSNAKNFLDYTGDVGTSDVIRGFDSGRPIDSVNPLGQGIVSGIGDAIGVDTGKGWIVCTELVKQGRMPRKYYVPGLRVFQSYRLDLLDGYYIWARPAVALLRTKPFCLRSRFITWFFNVRAEYLASLVGTQGAVDSFLGQVVSASVYGFCWILGQFLLLGKKVNEGKLV